ncbi:rhamnulokinase family protein [uncultured Megamonas sp.]|uniref:rhamnulokinase n=1 Tax=uncultured Megamonas sp. TaxID=286140 RepID=UPI0025EDA9F9|nr:rhamnulokinase family protein [uncultured Megamonas sp.]
MGKDVKVLALDFGASSGRAIIGTFDGKKISLKEIHRFTNDPVILLDTMYWDVLRLFHDIKTGLIKAKQEGEIKSLGIDTWGVDFGLLNKDGKLLENPVHYRDARTKGMMDKVFAKLDKDTIYSITGNQFMELNTLFQLMAIKENQPELLEKADTLLLMPDLLNYFLSNEKCTEYTIASTTQLLDAKNKKWSSEIIENLDLPKNIFTKIVQPGTKIGKLSKQISEELGINEIDIIAVAGHDTQSAMVAVPTQEDDFIFLSCGTWSLLGTELKTPIINETSASLNITNEGGADNKTSFLKNIIGLWLIQESRRQWIREGKEYGFGELEQMASKVGMINSFIDTDNEEFVSAGNIPKRIQEYCKRTGQYVPQNEAEIVRCIDQSLAVKYRFALEQIEIATGKKYDTLNIIGGGIQSKLLCQLTANVCGRKVVAGPVEATVMGNIALQLMALGEIKDIKEARRIVANSENVTVYEPQKDENWDEIYKNVKENLLC